MKRGSEYARRIKRLFSELTRKHGKPAPAAPTDPLDQMLVGILSECTSYSKGRSAFQRILSQMVDLNELRVTPASELTELIDKSVPLAAKKSQRLLDALNDIRRRQEMMDLTFLRERSRREAREYLESLEGVSPAVAAGVVLYSLGGHAIPVDNLTLFVLRKEELVDAAADAATVQGFLERHVSSSDACAFSDLLNRYVTAHGARVPVEQLDELLNPPPLASPEPQVPQEPDKASTRKPVASKKPKSQAATKAGDEKPSTQASAGTKGADGKPASKQTKTASEKSTAEETKATSRPSKPKSKKKGPTDREKAGTRQPAKTVKKKK